LTTDGGNTFQDISPNAWPFYGPPSPHSILQDPKGGMYLGTGQGVIQSTDNGRSWSVLPNSGGRTVAFAAGNGNFYSTDAWSPSFHTASASDPTNWTMLPAPDVGGCPFLDYDAAHHLLYASCFDAGTWRFVAQ
jgi:hypothetical protein